MPKIGNSMYIAKGQLEKFNRSPKKSSYLKNINEILLTGLFLLQDGKYSKKILGKKYSYRRWVKKYDIKQKIRVTAEIEPEQYVLIQSILEEITGELWPFDKFINFMCNWFIFTYQNPKNIKTILPFTKTNYNKRFENIKIVKRFNKRFSRFYKDIMGSWGDNIK